MRGLIFQPTGPVFEDESALVPRVINRKDFHKIFSVLYDDLLNFKWFIKGGYLNFHFPSEWVENCWYDEEQDLERSEQLDEYQAMIIQADGKNFTFAQPAFVPTYFRYFCDDWIDIYGLKESFDHPDEFNETYWSFKKNEPRNQWLSETVELYICNTDGMFWSFYSHHEDLIKKLENHVKNIKGFKITPASLLDKSV